MPNAFLPTGTMRSLSPLPMHRTQPTFASRSLTPRPVSSDTRNPVEYSTSSIALSRCPVGVLESGCSSSFSTSSSRKYPGKWRRIFGDSRLIDGSSAISSWTCANLKKFRSVTNCRATVRLSSFCRYNPARKSTRSSRPTLSTVSLRFRANSSNLFKSRLYAEIVFAESPFSTRTCIKYDEMTVEISIRRPRTRCRRALAA